MGTTKYQIGDNLWHKELKQFVQIVEIMGVMYGEATYRVIHRSNDRGEPVADWCYCIDQQLSINKVEDIPVFYLLRPENVVAWYAFEIKANSLEEAKQKLQEGEYEDSCLMGIDVDFGGEPLEDTGLIREINREEWDTFGYPNTNGYYST